MSELIRNLYAAADILSADGHPSKASAVREAIAALSPPAAEPVASDAKFEELLRDVLDCTMLDTQEGRTSPATRCSVALEALRQHVQSLQASVAGAKEAALERHFAKRDRAVLIARLKTARNRNKDVKFPHITPIGTSTQTEWLLYDEVIDAAIAYLAEVPPQAPSQQLTSEVPQDLASTWESEAKRACGFTTPQYIATKSIEWDRARHAGELPPLPLTKGYEPNCPYAPWVNDLLIGYGKQCYAAGMRLVPVSADAQQVPATVPEGMVMVPRETLRYALPCVMAAANRDAPGNIGHTHCAQIASALSTKSMSSAGGEQCAET